MAAPGPPPPPPLPPTRIIRAPFAPVGQPTYHLVQLDILDAVEEAIILQVDGPIPWVDV